MLVSVLFIEDDERIEIVELRVVLKTHEKPVVFRKDYLNVFEESMAKVYYLHTRLVLCRCENRKIHNRRRSVSSVIARFALCS